MRGFHPSPLLAALALAVAMTGCGAAASSTPSPSGSAVGSRPSSPAVVRILEPKAGAVVTQAKLHVVISLDNATIVSQTTTNIRPDQGHLHLYVDNVLVSMNYGLAQDIPVHKGTYVLKAEFVASDHAPFNPRVVSPTVVFTVR